MLISVNYHYIDSEQKYARGIYPTSIERLEYQLNELGKQYTFISQQDLLDDFSGKSQLPEFSCLITFDDGLQTQFTSAVPVLQKLNIPAIFFINSLPHVRNQACQVHKIHYLLSELEPIELLNQVEDVYKDVTGIELDIKQIQQSTAQKENRYDSSETVVVKYILNSFLKPELANDVVNIIFAKYHNDEKQFCEDLYLSKEHISNIASNPLFDVGLHTQSHINIPYQNKDIVVQDIADNYNFLTNDLNIASVKGISYPIGKISAKDISDKIEKVSSDLGLEYGLTMGRAINTHLNKPLFLARYDTNDVVGGKKPII